MRFIGAWGVVGSVAATMVVVGGFVLAREPEPLAGTPVRTPVLTVQQLDRSTYREWRALDDSPWAWGIEQEFYDYRPDRSGPHLNVTAGERRTLLTTVPGAPVVVWLVGSSFTYGVGQRDDWTVASAMVRRASADGIPLVVRNFAVPGDTAVMQHLAIEERLEAGEPAPDLVISVEGFNDVTFGVMATALRGSVEVPVLKNAEDALAYNLSKEAFHAAVVPLGRMIEAGMAAHILGRTGFGPYPGQVAEACETATDAAELVERRVEGTLPFEPRMTQAEPWVWSDEPPPQTLVDKGPVTIDGPDPDDPLAFDQDIVRNWWVNRMLLDEAGLHEKMMWTWHGIFTTSTDKARGLNPLFQQLRVLHRHSLGNFRDLAHEMQVSGAMLMYLDGEGSTIQGPPNENHARELMELFMLGLGTFTQRDVVAVSKVLAGWRPDSGTSPTPDYIVTFFPDSAATEPQTVLGRRGVRDVDDLIEVLLDHEACAPFVVGRLWDSLIGGPRDEGVIARWASSFRSSGYEIAPLVRQMLLSDTFARSARSRPRSAIEWYCASLRALGVRLPAVVARDLFRLGQCPYLPPSPAGWPHGDVWLSPGQSAARMRQVARFEVQVDQSLLDAPDLVAACLDRCSVVAVGGPTRDALGRLDAALAAIPEVPRADRCAAVLRAVLSSPEFSLA